MTTIFQIDEEIDKLIDKFSEDLKIRLKKIIIRSEKLVLKQYIASQRETAKAKKSSETFRELKVTSPSPKATSNKHKKLSDGTNNVQLGSRKVGGSPSRQSVKKVSKQMVPKREQDYNYYSDDSS